MNMIAMQPDRAAGADSAGLPAGNGWALRLVDGEVLLQRADAGDIHLEDDSDAWLHVWHLAARGSADHRRALDVLRTANPREYNRARAYCTADLPQVDAQRYRTLIRDDDARPMWTTPSRSSGSAHARW